MGSCYFFVHRASNCCVHAIHHLKLVSGLSAQVVASVGWSNLCGESVRLLGSNQQAITTEPRDLDSTVSTISVSPSHDTVPHCHHLRRQQVKCNNSAHAACSAPVPTPAKYSLGLHSANALQMPSLQTLDSAASHPSTTRSCLLQGRSP